MVKPYQDEKTLEYLYVEKRMTMSEIGEKLGVNATTIHKYLKRNNIPTRNTGTRYTKEEYLEYIKEYVDDHGEVPSQYDMGKLSHTPCKKAFQKRFGSWSKAVKEAGFEPRKDLRDV